MDEERNMVPIIGVARHRLAVDGQGVTTLVAFHGCTLRCQYCLNAQCLRPDGFSRTATPAELLDEVMIDNLYFLATGGGITFGGGEPAIRSEFIDAFCRMAPPEWHFTIETALNVERHHLERLLPHIHEYYIDIKDLNPDIYRRYTGQDNQRTLDNCNGSWVMTAWPTASSCASPTSPISTPTRMCNAAVTASRPWASPESTNSTTSAVPINDGTAFF